VGRAGRGAPDWWTAGEAPLVYVTFGSVAGGMAMAAAVYPAAIEAVAVLDVRVLLTVGHDTDHDAFGAMPANVRVESWAPQADALAVATAVVCHGGSGSTLGALAAGLPLVVVPRFADQPDNARAASRRSARESRCNPTPPLSEKRFPPFWSRCPTASRPACRRRAAIPAVRRRRRRAARRARGLRRRLLSHCFPS
jgi:hypothetical protein